MGCKNSKCDEKLIKPISIDKLIEAYNVAKQNEHGNVWIAIFIKDQYHSQELERHKDLISWSACSRYQMLPCWFITKYKSRIDFKELSCNEHLTDNIIDMFIDDLDFNALIRNTIFSQQLAEKLLLLPDLATYKKTQLLKLYKFNEPLLRPLVSYKQQGLYKDVISQYQNLLESFILDNTSAFNWNLINRYQCISLDFIENHPTLIRWDELSYNKNLTNDVVYKYYNKLKSTEEVELAYMKKIKTI